MKAKLANQKHGIAGSSLDYKDQSFFLFRFFFFHLIATSTSLSRRRRETRDVSSNRSREELGRKEPATRSQSNLDSPLSGRMKGVTDAEEKETREEASIRNLI